MIKAIIFDCFGVLATSEWKQFQEKYLDGSPELLASLRHFMREFNLGHITQGEFAKSVSKLVNADEGMMGSLNQESAPNIALFEYIKAELKPIYKIGLLSNAGGNWLPQLFSSQQMRLFDDVVLSYSVGFAKPDPQIYEISCKNLGLKPSEAVLIDDNQYQCDGAEAAGMHAILYKDLASLKLALQELLRANNDIGTRA